MTVSATADVAFALTQDSGKSPLVQATLSHWIISTLKISQSGEPTNCNTDSEWDASICLDGETCAVGAVTLHNWAETYCVVQNGTGVDVGFFTQLVLLCTVRSGLEVGEWQGQQ